MLSAVQMPAAGRPAPDRLPGDRRALDRLGEELGARVRALGLNEIRFGDPDTVREAAAQAAALFQEYACARPSREDAREAALAFLAGKPLTEDQLHLVASALCERLPEHGGRRPIGHPDAQVLLRVYEEDAGKHELSPLTWFGLLCSYFEFDPLTASADEGEGWLQLRAMLARSWPAIDREVGLEVVPDWVAVLRDQPALLTDAAADQFALDYLRGEEAPVKRLAEDLGIAPASWFWHRLVLGAVTQAAAQSDAVFKGLIGRLLSLLDSRRFFRDDGLEQILTRYHRCEQAPLHRGLRDFAIRRDVWHNPELRSRGLATAWNRVDDAVWKMVLQWGNQTNLKDFFSVLAGGDADEGRLAFWAQFAEQISWTRFVFCAQTRALARRRPGVRELMEREDGAYATFWRARGVDGLMMQIGDYVVVEFSTPGTPAYVYDARRLSFDRLALKYQDSLDDLNYGFRDAAVMRIVRRGNWQDEAEAGLAHLGIMSDRLHRLAAEQGFLQEYQALAA